jgi:hypothetical protein
MTFCGCDAVQNCLEHNMKQPDKPLFYQNRWWYINSDRDYFWWPNQKVWGEIHYYRSTNIKEGNLPDVT